MSYVYAECKYGRLSAAKNASFCEPNEPAPAASAGYDVEARLVADRTAVIEQRHRAATSLPWALGASETDQHHQNSNPRRLLRSCVVLLQPCSFYLLKYPLLSTHGLLI
ncbi:hypothetical protein KQX54_011048 [Cotesia glomerata]|uniref:Uncharacterized protein n=1 Tax=Cotesia glomerata TaxID=32391 RepID=A0AAV7IKA4_COTGL|nr:hypothetical protein KQX54_011048 [Cotesia glomerata]